MQFNSYAFLLVFFPILIIGYFVLNKLNLTAGKLYLAAGSAIFYFYGGKDFALILGASIVFNYVIAIILAKIKRFRKAVLVLSIVGNIGLLVYFKYFDFVLSNISQIFKAEYTLRNLLLPLGISFFAFQQISYIVNIYWRAIEKADLIDYLAYILYFPKLLIGPIMEPLDLIGQLNDPERKRVDWDNIAFGLKAFSFGFFKKLVLADTFAKAVTWGFSNQDAATSMDWFLVMLCYFFEIYFDFSGYSDMAAGASLMLNIRLPMNFDSPYKALSIRDFWKRWHMSLTGFLTKYIYIPLGGSKRGNIRTYVNTIIVFLISGIWHGANWTFILWGVLHGLLNIFDRMFGKVQRRLTEVVRWFGTFTSVNLLWMLFRSDSIEQWKNILIKMFTFQNMAVSDGLLQAFILPETRFLNNFLHLAALNGSVRGLWCLIFMLGAFLLCLISENNCRNLTRNHLLYMPVAAAAFVWAFLCLSSESVFVYFGF